MVDIFSLFEQGWSTIWKEKTLWFFGALSLVEPVIEFIFVQHYIGHSPSLLELVVSFSYVFFLLISIAGMINVVFCVTVGKSVNFRESFLVAKKSLVKIIKLFLLLSPFFATFMCLILAFSIKQSGPFLIFSRNLYIANLLLSIFNAMIYFPIVEIVANDSGVRKSIKIAWGVFAKHFIIFTIIGFILAVSMQVISTVIGVTATLIKYSFSLKALINLDFVTPYLSFPDNKFYRLASTTGGTIWNVYSITILVLAYLKYSGVKTNTT